MTKVARQDPDKGYTISVETGVNAGHSTPSSTSEFDRFANLAGSLVKVPKAELDEERQKS